MENIIINYWAVVVSAASAMVTGFLWYGPLFGKMWIKLQGLNQEDIEKAKAQGTASNYAFVLVSALVTAYVLAHLARLVGVDSFGSGGWQCLYHFRLRHTFGTALDGVDEHSVDHARQSGVRLRQRQHLVQGSGNKLCADPIRRDHDR